MHVRLKQNGKIDFGADLKEDLPPGADIVFISAHDSELAQLARAADVLTPHGRTLSLCSYLSLLNAQSIPLLIERTLPQAGLVVLRMISGSGYWPEGIEALREMADRLVEAIQRSLWKPRSISALPVLQHLVRT